MNKKCSVLCIILLVILNSVYAKRAPVPEVVPLENSNYIFSAGYTGTLDNNYAFGVLKIESKGEIKYNYTVPLYAVKIDKLLERDVQCVFVKSMKFKNENIIVIVNEKNETFEFDIDTYEVTCISGKNDKKINDLFNNFLNEKFFSTMIEYKGTQPEKKQLKKIEDVISIAENALFPIYGKDKIKKEMPYNIYKSKNKWYVNGSLPEGWIGGVFEIIINTETSQVEYYIHGK